MGGISSGQILGAMLLFGNSNVKKINGKFVLDVYFPQTKDLVERLALEAGVEVVVNLKVLPRYFPSPQEYWETKKKESPILQEFEKKLGLVYV